MVAAADVQGPTELPEFAGGLGDAIRAIQKSLYLEPQLRVCASAGWSSAYDCVESVSRAMCGGGGGDLALSAVRGSNLLPILEMLVADGVDLTNADTGQPWRELRAPLLAADLQLGAGPLVAAMAEGARVMVVGCCDGTAPLVAAAVSEFGWNWSDFDRLSGAATAAEAAAWSDWLVGASGESDSMQEMGIPSSPPRVALEASGASSVDLGLPADASALQSMWQWLLRADAPEAARMHADVICRGVEISATAQSQLRLRDCKGAKTDGCWRLEVLYQAGFAAEALLEIAPRTDPKLRRQLAAAIRSRLQAADDGDSLTTVEELHFADRAAGPGWIHAACQSKSQAACGRFVEQTLRLAAAHRSVLRLASGRPVVHVHCGLWPARIPRDAVDIAVETRLAKEWN